LNPLPSTDLYSKATAKGVVVAQSYIFATTPEFKYLDMLLKMLAPKEYKKGTATAGRWYTKQTEGCTLGLTTTWKVQVCLHLDRGDWELCMVFCRGNFLRENLYFPDLNLCLV
jgi:hypothetical protein